MKTFEALRASLRELPTHADVTGGKPARGILVVGDLTFTF